MRANIARRRRATRRAAALLLGLVATTACATYRYRSLSEQWERTENSALPTGDDRPFGDAPVLERPVLVQRVLDHNPNVRAARYAWRAALARYPQVTALDDPMLSAGVAPRSFGSSTVDGAYNVGLSQALPFPGKLRLKGEAALGEAEAAAHDFEAVRLRLAAMASMLFDDYYVAARTLELNGEHIALLESFQKIATARYEAGQAAQQDPIQAEVELSHALHDKILFGTGMRVVVEQINALLHRAPSAPLPPPPARADAMSAAPELAPEDLVRQALAGRPELGSAAAKVSAEQARVDLAHREYFPDVTLNGGYDGFWDQRDLRPSVGLSVNVPLQLGRRAAAVDEAEARLEQARSERVAIEDEVRLDVQSGAERLVEAHHVLNLISDRQLPASRDQVEAARAGFETGRNSFLALIDAERNLRNVELAYEQALANVSRRRAELDRAMGRIAGLSW